MTNSDAARGRGLQPMYTCLQSCGYVGYYDEGHENEHGLRVTVSPTHHIEWHLCADEYREDTMSNCVAQADTEGFCPHCGIAVQVEVNSD